MIGTSIGAINAALIAGSKPGERVEKLCEFWSRVQNDHLIPPGLPSWMATAARNWRAITRGRSGLLQPQPDGVPQPAQPARRGLPRAIIRSIRCAEHSKS